MHLLESDFNGYELFLVYVDDILIFTPTDSEKNAVVPEFRKVYEVRIAGDVKFLLGILYGSIVLMEDSGLFEFVNIFASNAHWEVLASKFLNGGALLWLNTFSSARFGKR